MTEEPFTVPQFVWERLCDSVDALMSEKLHSRITALEETVDGVSHYKPAEPFITSNEQMAAMVDSVDTAEPAYGTREWAMAQTGNVRHKSFPASDFEHPHTLWHNFKSEAFSTGWLPWQEPEAEPKEQCRRTCTDRRIENEGREINSGGDTREGDRRDSHTAPESPTGEVTLQERLRKAKPHHCVDELHKQAADALDEYENRIQGRIMENDVLRVQCNAKDREILGLKVKLNMEGME